MGYEIPPDIRYREKIVAGLDWRQFLYLLVCGIISLIVYSSDVTRTLKTYLAVSVMGLGMALAFFNFDRTMVHGLRYGMARLKIWRMSNVLYEFLGFEEIKNDRILMTDKSSVAVIEVEGINFGLLMDEQREDIIEGFREFLNSLNFEVQLVVRSIDLDMSGYFNRLEELNADGSGRVKSLKNFLMEYLRKNRIMEKKCYLVVPLRGTRPLLDLPSLLKRKSGRKEDLEELEKRVHTVMEGLNDAGLSPRRLTSRELAELILSYFDAVLDGSEYLSDYVKVSATGLTYDSIKINERYSQVIMASEYPDSVFPGWLEKLILMPGDFDFTIHVKPTGIAESIRMVNNQIRKLETDVVGFENKGLSVPVPVQLKLQGGKDLLRRVQSGSERLFHTSMYVNARAYTRKGLKRLTDIIYSRFRSVMIEPATVTLDVENAIKSVLPLASDRLKELRILTSSSLSACFPFLSSSLKTDGEPIMLGFNDDTGVPVMVDFASLMNGNCCILGMAGSGKSYSLKLWLMKLLLYPDRTVYILDKEGEYSEMVEKLGGQVVHISPTSGTVINPLDLFDMDLASKKVSLLLFFHSLFEVTPAQETMLIPLFDEVYSMRSINDDPDTWSNEPPVLDDIYSLVEKRAEVCRDPDEQRTANALLRKLRLYARGTARRMFNGKTNINLNDRVVSFDISKVPKHTVNPIMYTILEFLVNRMESNLTRKTIVIDEGWHILSNPDIADRVLGVARVGRKTNTSLIISTQMVKDLLENGESILANSPTKYIFWQDTSVMGDIVRTFNLNRKEARRISSVGGVKGGGVGRGILIVENQHIPLRVIASPEEHEIITTNPDELLKRQDKSGKTRERAQVEYMYKTDRKVVPVDELDETQVRDLRKQGYRIVRDLGLSRAGRRRYSIINDTQESDEHFILSQFIYDEVRKYTDECSRNYTRAPDIIFKTPDGKTVAVEVENRYVARGKELLDYPEFEEKVNLLKKKASLQKGRYDEVIWVPCNMKYRKKYRRVKLGRVCSRTKISGVIRKYFRHGGSILRRLSRFNGGDEQKKV